MEVKRLGAHHPNDAQITQKDKQQNCNFCVTWFQRTDWLTASVAGNSLFCFPCLLFGGDTVWTQQGIVDLKYLSDKIRKHECSMSHIGNAVKLSLLGKVNIACQLNMGHHVAVHRHNELVKKKNRHSLSRIVDCIKFCGGHELALRGSDESPTSIQQGVFLDLFDQFSFLDSRSPVKHTGCTHIQDQPNELLDCMLQIYGQKPAVKIWQASFVAVQADETTDVACVIQCVTLVHH